MFNPQLVALFQQIIQVLVPVIGGLDNVVVEYQVIAGAVAHQHLAVPVQNIAPGSTDGGDGTVGHGVIGVALGIDDLQLKQPEGEKRQNEREQYNQYNGAQPAYSFH